MFDTVPVAGEIPFLRRGDAVLAEGDVPLWQREKYRSNGRECAVPTMVPFSG